MPCPDARALKADGQSHWLFSNPRLPIRYRRGLRKPNPVRTNMNIYTHIPSATAASITTATFADLSARRAALRPLWLLPESEMSDAECDVLSDEWSEVEDEILKRPCRTIDDLMAKFAVWSDLVADPALIMDEHTELFAGLQRDIVAMIGARQ